MAAPKDRGEGAAGGKARDSGQDPMRIDSALVRELARLLTENELTEIEVEDGDRKIKVKREAASVAAAPAASIPAAAAPSPHAAAPSMPSASSSAFNRCRA